MAYIERAQDGKIKGVYAVRQPGYAEEELSGNDPAVLAFLSPPPPPRDLAAEIDTLKAELRRTKAAEAVLIEKGTITAAEIDAKVPAREVGAIEAAKP